MIRNPWLWLAATFRLDLQAVCEMSRDRGPHDDFHDYPDSIVGEPWHGYLHTCKRCGKDFTI